MGIDQEVGDAPTERADHRGGGVEIARHLIGLGRRRIALRIPPVTLVPSVECVAGYKHAHIQAGIKVDPTLIRPQAHGSSIAFSDVCHCYLRPS